MFTYNDVANPNADFKINAVLLSSKKFNSDEKLVLAQVLNHELFLKQLTIKVSYTFPLRSLEIGTKIGLSRTVAKGILEKLHEDGWINSLVDSDNRARQTELTSKFYNELNLGL